MEEKIKLIIDSKETEVDQDKFEEYQQSSQFKIVEKDGNKILLTKFKE